MYQPHTETDAYTTVQPADQYPKCTNLTPTTPMGPAPVLTHTPQPAQGTPATDDSDKHDDTDPVQDPVPAPQPAPAAMKAKPRHLRHKWVVNPALQKKSSVELSQLQSGQIQLKGGRGHH